LVDAHGARPSPYAAAQDAFSGATNPALAVLVKDRIDPCARFIYNPQRAAIVGNSKGFNAHSNANSSKVFFYAEGAVNKNFKIAIGCREWELSAGFATYVDANVANFDKGFSLFGTSHLCLNIFNRTYSTYFALKLTEAHCVGVSIDVYQRHVSIYGLQHFDTPEASVAPGFVTNKGASHAFGVTPLLGWYWKINEKWQFGAIYRPKIHMSKLHHYKGLYPQHGLSNQPQRLGAGFAYKVTEKVGVAAEFEWANYKNVQYHLPLLNSQGTINQLGSKKGPYHGLRDGYRYAAGIRYIISDMWTVRCSYSHYNKIVPRSQTILGFGLPCVTQQVAANVTCTVGKNEITMLYAHGFHSVIKGRNSVPSFFGGGEANITERSRDNLLINWGYVF
jgi:long-chain fatty acid transport protein